jgi:predicted amidohydrolase YtcJ
VHAGADVTVFSNARVITLDSYSTIESAIAVRGGKILAVGGTEEVVGAAGSHARVVDVRGSTIVPGFVDAHAHMDRVGLREIGGISLEGASSVADIVEIVRCAANHTAPGEWIVLLPMGAPGRYVHSPAQLHEGRFPTRHDLDAVAPNNPVFIRSVWGWWSTPPFPAIANSQALGAAGIGSETEAPYRVEIVRDSSGQPTGVFLDSNYQSILEHSLFRVVPRFTFEDRAESVRRGSIAYAKAGTTTISEGHGLSPELIRAYRRVHQEGDLLQRAHLSVSAPSSHVDDDELVELFLHLSGLVSDRGSGDDMLRVEGVTLDSADQTLADVIASDHPNVAWASHFTQGLSSERLVALGTRAAELGIRVYGMAGYGVESVLSAFEKIHEAVPIDASRWVLTHLLHATEDQIARIKALGLVVTVNPMFIHRSSERLGLIEHESDAMPLGKWNDAGLVIAMETDGAPHSMLWTLWEALVRWDDARGVALGHDKITREDVLRLICQGGHFLTWNEQRSGILGTGRDADLLVLDEDVLTCDLDEIRNTSVLMTMVDGRVVHATPEFEAFLKD